MNFMLSAMVSTTYGKIEYQDLDGGWVRITNDFESKYLEKVQLPWFKAPRLVHKMIVPALKKALHVIETNAHFDPEFEYIEDIQIFAPRHIMNNVFKALSCHAYGIAFDINPWENMPGYPSFKIPQKIVDIFEGVGFIWGGRMRIKDYMHFEPSKEFQDYKDRW